MTQASAITVYTSMVVHRRPFIIIRVIVGLLTIMITIVFIIIIIVIGITVMIIIGIVEGHRYLPQHCSPPSALRHIPSTFVRERLFDCQCSSAWGNFEGNYGKATLERSGNAARPASSASRVQTARPVESDSKGTSRNDLKNEGVCPPPQLPCTSITLSGGPLGGKGSSPP